MRIPWRKIKDLLLRALKTAAKDIAEAEIQKHTEKK